MLTELCQELKNWFVRDKYIGTFKIEGGALTSPSLVANQYYRIIGSLFNDGVHKNDNSEPLTDEVFTGAVWSMAIPPAVIELAGEIEDWVDKYGESVSSPFQSESFGGYSYTKAGSGSAAGNSGAGGWKSAFASKMHIWRKI